jgi:hypothetical protein
MKNINWKRENKKSTVVPSTRDINIITRGYKRLIILVVVTAISILGWWLIQKDQAWVLSQTEYEGLINLQKHQIDSVIEDQFGKFMNKVDPDELEERIKNEFVEIGDVRAEKMFPDKIHFTVVEKIPVALYININGYYLIDINGEVIKAYNSETIYTFSNQDYEIARGFGSPNADYVEERIFNELLEEEMEEFNFAEYEYSKKQEVLANIQIERKTKIDDLIQINLKQSQEKSFPDVRTVYGWDETAYKIGDTINPDLIDFVLNVFSQLDIYKDVKVDEILWDGEQRIILFFNIDGEIVISRKRDIPVQFEDLSLIVKKIGEIDKIKRIDLSVPKVVVDYR